MTAMGGRKRGSRCREPPARAPLPAAHPSSLRPPRALAPDARNRVPAVPEAGRFSRYAHGMRCETARREQES